MSALNGIPNKLERFAERLTPQNIEAERVVLGSLMLDNRLADDAEPLLKADAFYSEVHAVVYRELLKMPRKADGCDVMLLASRLQALGQFDAIGGYAGLAALTDSVGSVLHLASYVAGVKAAAVRRSLYLAGIDIAEQAYNLRDDQQVAELTNRAEARILSLGDATVAESLPFDKTVEAAFEQLTARYRGETPPSGLLTELADLDRPTGGLHPSTLVILAARPSVGKSALAGHIALVVARRGVGVYFASLEMSAVELVTRWLSSMADVDAQRISFGRMNDIEFERVSEAAATLSGLSLYVNDRPRMSVIDIARDVRRIKRRASLGLVIVDYLQLIDPSDRKPPRHEQVGDISRNLKALAKELSAPVLALAQLNRQVDASGDKRPRLAHLRESGSIEQDADQVWLLHRPGMYEPKRDDLRHVAELDIAKHRSGPTALVTLHWRPETQEFLNASNRDDRQIWNEYEHAGSGGPSGEYP